MTRKDLASLDVDVGQRVRALRLQKGLGLQKLADRLGVTSEQIQKYENGAVHIGAGRLQLIADILGVQAADFFTLSGRQQAAPVLRRRA